jgi:diguanylate cyclase (GGDEF)-like protein
MTADPVTSGGPRRSVGQRLSAVTQWPLADTVESHVRAERVRIIYRHGPPAQLLSLVAAAVICWVLWEHGSHSGLVVWWLTLTGITLARIGLVVLFQRRQPPPEQMLGWERVFVTTLGLVTLAWGLGGLLVMPRDSLLHQALVYFFLMGVAAGAVATYGAHVVATAVAVCCLMVPATVAFAFSGPFEMRVFAAAGLLFMAAALRSTRSFGFFLRRTFQLSYELRGAYARVREQSRTDELTQLANRRAFLELGAAAMDQSRRYERPLSLVMLDIDHFKKINDTYGHAAGDTALRAMATALRAAARVADTPGRLGGEEFAILLPETNAAEAVVMAERIREDVKALEVMHDGTTIRFTTSIGVAEEVDGIEDIDALLHAADEALYDAKEGGRDRVVVKEV